jgi:GNAT superfamily N-acetyltransferase
MAARPQPFGEGQITCEPLTPGRWRDLERLFGPKGACDGCWCMWFRLKRSEWEAGRREGNRRRLKRLVESGPPPGLLAYLDGEPVGWVSLGRRQDFPVLGRSRLLKPVDDSPVWSVVCFFVDRRYRGRGVMGSLMQAAESYAASQGAAILEAYPADDETGTVSSASAYTGLVRLFRRAGFQEVARRSPKRPIMRKDLGQWG